MTRKLVAGLVAGALLVTMLACTCPWTLVPSTTTQATVRILQPAEGTIVGPGQPVPVVAFASDPAGLTRLEVEVDGALLVTQSSPQAVSQLTANGTWSSTSTGLHVILARAFTAGGQATQSAPVVVQVQTTSAQGVTPVPATQPPATQVPPTQRPPTAFPPPTQPPPPPNHAPVITAVTADRQTVEAGGTVALAVSAYDPDGDPIVYSWNVPWLRGTVAGEAAATYTAPTQPSGMGLTTVTAIVTDNHGATAAKGVDITVVRPGGVYDAGPAFQGTWRSDQMTQDKLGWATEAQRNLPSAGTNNQAVEQPFDRGFLFWYGDVRLIYSLYIGDQKWQAFDDTFSWANPAPTALPPTGCTAPIQGGFREVWWNELNVRARLGCPLQQELPANGTIQLFQRGLMIKSGLTGRVFVLFPTLGGEGTWR